MRNDWIILKEYCDICHIEPAFINSLCEDGLIELEKENDEEYIPLSQLDELDKYVRLHYDLEINIEGLDAIHNLLGRVEHLQEEVKMLENELRFYRTF